MKSIFVIFCALFLLIALPYVFERIDRGQSQEVSVDFAGIATGSGEYTANFTLPDKLWNNSRTSVLTVSSNLSSDSPSASAYNSVSRLLTISGLEQGMSRTVEVDYLITSTTMPDFMVSTVFPLLRWFYMFMIMGATIGAIYAFFTS